MTEGNWVTAWWGRGPLSTTITTDHTFEDAVPALGGRTLRLMAHLTAGGVRARVRLSQRYSAEPLRLAQAALAWRHRDDAVLPGSSRPLTFGGALETVVPAGGDVWSDPVDLLVPAGDVALSFFLPDPWVPTTQGGRGQTKTSYHAPGNQVSELRMHDAVPTRQVFLAFEIQVWSPVPAAAIAALGDSITEGACSALDANASWPELLGRRLPLLPDGRRTAVINAGVGSGRWASSDGAGTRGLNRLDELLELPHLAWVIVHMGVNDVSYEGVNAAFLIESFVSALGKARRAGVSLALIPLLPFGGSSKDIGANVLTAQEVNRWIRAHGPQGAPPRFDAVLDVEDVFRTPGDTWAMRPELTADGVHPNQEGYAALAAALPVDRLRPSLLP